MASFEIDDRMLSINVRKFRLADVLLYRKFDKQMSYLDSEEYTQGLQNIPKNDIFRHSLLLIICSLKFLVL